MLRKIIGFLLVGLALCGLVRAITSFNQARHSLHQAQKMHALAVQHRAYKPEATWKHDERVYIDAGRRNEAMAIYNLTWAVILGGSSLIVLFDRKPRPYRSTRATSGSYLVGPDTYKPVYAPKSVSDDRLVSPSVAPPRKTAQQIRDELGRRGEEQLVTSLQPLLVDGWRLERNVVVETAADGKFGDIDVLMTSPNAIGYSIDAKNGTQRVWYDDKTEEVVFDKGWTPKGGKATPPRRYAVANAEYLAAWAQRTFHLQKVVSIMAFTDNHDLRIEKTVRSFHMLKLRNVVDCLRAIDAGFDRPSRNVDRDKPSQQDG